MKKYLCFKQNSFITNNEYEKKAFIALENIIHYKERNMIEFIYHRIASPWFSELYPFTKTDPHSFS